MVLKIGQIITLCGLEGHIAGHDKYYVYNSSSSNDAYFVKIGLTTQSKLEKFYNETLGYISSGTFPSVRTLEHLEKLVNRMNFIYSGGNESAAEDLLVMLIERLVPGLGRLLKSSLKVKDIEEIKNLEALCETPEEFALYYKIVPRSVLLARDTYERWLRLHPDTKLTAPAVRLFAAEKTKLSPEEETIWKEELETEEDKVLFDDASRV